MATFSWNPAKAGLGAEPAKNGQGGRGNIVYPCHNLSNSSRGWTDTKQVDKAEFSLLKVMNFQLTVLLYTA